MPQSGYEPCATVHGAHALPTELLEHFLNAFLNVVSDKLAKTV